jgi:hypothetical protein
MIKASYRIYLKRNLNILKITMIIISIDILYFKKFFKNSFKNIYISNVLLGIQMFMFIVF